MDTYSITKPKSTAFMLSRIGSYLFWMGRYLERCEHLARYVKVQYYQVLDAPRVMSREQALESILFMVGGVKAYYKKFDELTDEDVLRFCCFDQENEFSIVNIAYSVRENARSSRDLISVEAWESINRFYHSLSRYSVRNFLHERRHDFCQHVIESAYIIKGLLQNTLLHDHTWSMINIGMNLERAIQTNQILLAKLRDIQAIDREQPGAKLLINYHWGNMLRSTGGFDLSRKMYRDKRMQQHRYVLEFLVLNPYFPKSITHNLNALQHFIKQIQLSSDFRQDSSLFLVGKVASQLQYTMLSEVTGNSMDFLEELRFKLYQIGNSFQEQYLSY